MKRALLTSALLMVFISVFARQGGRSTLRISLSDDQPLVVSIDGRNYDRHGRTITIGDLPRGWHSLRVYRYIEYKEGGGRAKLLYSGRIKVGEGTITNCVIDVRTSRLRINAIDANNVIAESTAEPAPADDKLDILTDKELDALQERVTDRATDINKLELLKTSLEHKQYYTLQVRDMAKWLAFESSRLDFIKWSYGHVIDNGEYEKLEDVFTLDKSREEFREFVKSR